MSIRQRGKQAINFNDIILKSAFDRQNQVYLANLLPLRDDIDTGRADGAFTALCKKIRESREKGKPVIMFIGAHVIKNGLSLFIVELMRRGLITHIAGNGAVSIHDFELAFLGATSEDVPTAIEDGSFGMWKETGGWMNQAIKQGAALGYGQAVAEYMEQNAERFPHKDISVLYNAYKFRVPATIHVTIGCDIIHQHPAADFGAIGEASGRDFHKLCESVSHLEDGVFMNFGSAVTGPEVFLKALSIARNLGYARKNITTANFDIKPLGDFRKKVDYDDPDYYYRPRKNIVNRPTQTGGTGWHFEMDHKVSIPLLYRILTQ